MELSWTAPVLGVCEGKCWQNRNERSSDLLPRGGEDGRRSDEGALVDNGPEEQLRAMES